MLIKRLWCWLTGGELVWLRDFDGEATLSIAYVNPWGERIAKRLLSNVVLNDDGSTRGASYVKQWKPYKSQQGATRVE